MRLFIFFIILSYISPSFGSEDDSVNTSIDTTSQGNEDIAVSDPESPAPEPIDITPPEASKLTDEEYQDAPETVTRDYTLDAQPINTETQIDVLNRKIEGLEKKIEELEEVLSQKEAGDATQTKKEPKDDGHSIDSFNSSDASVDFEKIKQMAINKNPEIEHAVEFFKKNHKGNTLCAKVHFFLADYWYSQKDYAKTLELIKKGLSEYKGSKEEPKAAWLLGLTFHEMGQKKESCVAFKKLESLKDVDADLKQMLSKNLKSLNAISPFVGQHIAIAVSGGPDSMAILYSFLEYYDNSKIHVLTVDHKLRTESTTEANFVKDFCNKHNIRHETLTWTSPYKGQKRARDARYDLLRNYCEQNNIKHLFTAHHKNDRQETFLMRIWQGSDLMGLASISIIVKKNNIFVLRPFLNTPQRDILDYIKKKEIPFCTDPSNENEIYLRTLARKNLSSVHVSYFRFMELIGKIRSFLENTTLKILEENLICLTPFLIKIDLKVFEAQSLIQNLLLQFLARLVEYEGFFPKLKLVNLLGKLDKKQSTTAFGILWSISKDNLYLSKENGLKEKIKIIKIDDGFHILPYDIKIIKKIEDACPFEIKILSPQDLEGLKKSPWINFLLSKTHIPLVGIIFSEEIVFIEELLYNNESMEAKGWFFDFPKNNYTKNIPIPFSAFS